MDYFRWLLTVYGSLASGGGSAPFSPRSLFPHLWLDPSDLSTLFQDAGMTTPVTADMDPVGAILDKSGNGHHLTQATAGSRPLYRTSGGLHWLESDGVDDFLQASYTGIAQPWDRVSAFRRLNATNNVHLIGDSTAGVLNIDSSGILMMYSGVGFSAGTAPTSGVDFVTTEHSDGASSRLAVDNGSYSTGDAGPNANSQITLAARDTGLQNFSNQRFYGLAQFDRALTDSEIASLRTYLAAKQGRSL